MTTESATPDLGAIKERQQETWASGDFTKIGNLMVLMGERLCEAVDLRAGERVLDVATGSGNAAISAARRFCEVAGVDYVPELIEYARTYFGPMLKAFESLDPEGQDALARDLEELLDRWNTSGDGTLVVPGDYLEVVATRR